MSKPSLTDLYIQEMTAAVGSLSIEDIDFEHLRYTALKDMASRDNLVMRCAPMVLAQIKRMRVPNEFLDDCIQAGNLAVLKAIDSYSPEGGYRWTSWAWRYISTDIQREVDRLSTPGHAPYSEETEEEWQELGEAEQEVEIASLRRLIQGLPDRQREVMELVSAGHDVAGASRVMEVSRQSGHRLYEKAVKALRKAFGVEGGDNSG